MVALAATLLLATPAAAGGASDLLPDMRMAKSYDLDLETPPERPRTAPLRDHRLEHG